MSTLKSINVQHPSATTTNIVNDSSGNVTVGNNLTVTGTATLTGATTVGGVAAVAVAPGTSGNVLTSNGTAWTSAAPSGGTAPSAIGQIPFSTNGSTYTPTQKIVQGTAVASTSGTSIDFTSIPSWVKRVTVMFNGVSLSGSAVGLVQLGTSGGVVVSGYAGSASNLGTGASYTTGCGLAQGSAASSTFSGHLIMTLITGNTWVFSGTMGRTDSAVTMVAASSIALSGALTTVRITTSNGTDTFDAGSINIMWE